MKKDLPMSDFNQKAIYEFVNRNGFKNVAEYIAHLGMHEFKRKKEQFFKDYLHELRSKPVVIKKESSKLIVRKKLAPRVNKDTKFHLRLISVHKLIISDLSNEPTLKLNHLALAYGINKKYVYALVHLNMIKNYGTKYFPHWKIIVDEINWEDLANKSKILVNQKNNESRNKNQNVSK